MWWLLVTNVKLESSKTYSAIFFTIASSLFCQLVWYTHTCIHLHIRAYTIHRSIILVTHALLDIHSIQPLYIPVSHTHIIHSLTGGYTMIIPTFFFHSLGTRLSVKSSSYNHVQYCPVIRATQSMQGYSPVAQLAPKKVQNSRQKTTLCHHSLI